MIPRTENPWNIESIYMLQYFICPSCGYKHVSKQNIIFHAFESHPESVNYLKNITDGSLYDVLCPWDSRNYINDDTGNYVSKGESRDRVLYILSTIAVVLVVLSINLTGIFFIKFTSGNSHDDLSISTGR